ncbi:MAG: hypothetical protein ACI8RD_005984 [Bacillariaceae sp.]|jgi:hypothetical protein
MYGYDDTRSSRENKNCAKYSDLPSFVDTTVVSDTFQQHNI